jgi:hypothetical protein
MSILQIFPLLSEIRRMLFPEPRPLIEKEFRQEIRHMDNKALFEAMEKIKRGETVAIGKKNYSRHTAYIADSKG